MLNLLSSNKSFGGEHRRYSHASKCNHCEMRFAIYLPPGASAEHPVPVLYWLSGLTCNEENFMQKAGAMRIAARLGIAIVAPDTSPRGESVADDSEGAYDLGLGAGFYLDATQAPWSAHYKMKSYILDELLPFIESNFPVSQKRAISGHSMGGHGALTLALQQPELFSSVSAFSPICNPVKAPWGQKAFSAYLGSDQSHWNDYDACYLVQHFSARHPNMDAIPMMIEQGSADEFLAQQLMPNNFMKVALASEYPVLFNMREGYDHSYYFIQSFIDEHLQFHAEHLLT